MDNIALTTLTKIINLHDDIVTLIRYYINGMIVTVPSVMRTHLQSKAR